MLADIELAAEGSMKTAVASFQTNLEGVSIDPKAFLDAIEVDYYGTPTPVSKLATITVVDPGLVTITPWDSGLVDVIDAAIRKANPGIYPMSDGELVSVPIPPLGDERRRELVKQILGLAEPARIAVRSAATDAMGQLGDDERTAGEVQLGKLRDRYIDAIDDLVRAKQGEIRAA